MMVDECGLLKNYWYVAAQARNLKIDVPICSMILEVPIVLWRNKDLSVVAMLDRCSHRNAPLSKGQIIDGCIKCPYHGWTYNSKGDCIHIPSEGPHKERIPNKGVEKFPVQEKYGLIWVWMGRDVTPDKEPFPMPTQEGKPGWKNYYMLTHFKNNVTDLVENFMDVPHTIFVHQGWFRDKKQLKVPMVVERTDDSVLVTYEQKNDSIGAFNALVNPKKLPMVHTDKFYMPNVTRVDYIFGEEERGFIITSTCTPVRPFETIVYTLISYKFGWMNPLAKFWMPWYTRKVIEQDVWIMELHGENIKQFKTTEYKSTQADTLHLYIESLRNWAENGGNKPKPAQIKKEAEFWI